MPGTTLGTRVEEEYRKEEKLRQWDPYSHPHFTDEKTEIERGEVTCKVIHQMTHPTFIQLIFTVLPAYYMSLEDTVTGRVPNYNNITV